MEVQSLGLCGRGVSKEELCAFCEEHGLFALVAAVKAKQHFAVELDEVLDAYVGIYQTLADFVLDLVDKGVINDAAWLAQFAEEGQVDPDFHSVDQIAQKAELEAVAAEIFSENGEGPLCYSLKDEGGALHVFYDI